MKQPMVYDEELRVDYEHLESLRCLCGKRKAIGDLFCQECLEFMPIRDMDELRHFKPGEGIAEAATRIHARLDRSKKKR